MGELLKLGIHPESINFSLKADERLVSDYQNQISAASKAAWGRFWTKNVSDRVNQSGLYTHIARTTARAARILGIKTAPKLGLLDGFAMGKIKYLGYCWENEAGQTCVGLDESWFGDVTKEIVEAGGRIPAFLRTEISFVVSEEVFHVYIREANPALAAQNIQLNASGKIEDYRNSSGEIAAKEFAGLYVASENRESLDE